MTFDRAKFNEYVLCDTHERAAVGGLTAVAAVSLFNSISANGRSCSFGRHYHAAVVRGAKGDGVSILTPASGMPTKRRCVELTSLITKPWVAVAPIRKTTTGNQSARGDIRRSRFLRVDCDVMHCASSETVARNLASATKTVEEREGLRSPIPFYSFNDFGAGASDSRKQTKQAQKRGVVKTMKRRGATAAATRYFKKEATMKKAITLIIANPFTALLAAFALVAAIFKLLGWEAA